MSDRQTSKKVDEYWLAFSDSEENITYADPHGRKELAQLGFLQPLLVLGTRNGYCKVVAYSKEILTSGGPIGNLIGKKKKKYRLVNRKKAQYLGWIRENHLLHSAVAIVDKSNLLPLKHLTAISHPKMITSRNLYLDKDSVLLAQAPGFRKKYNAKAPIGDWMYVYKKIGKPAQYLVGTEPFIDPDSAFGAFGWVSDSMILPLAQNMVLLPTENHSPDSSLSQYPVRRTNERHSEFGVDSSKINLEKHPIQPDDTWMLPVHFPVAERLDSNRQDLRTFIPMDLVDMQKSKVFNCIGQPFTFPEYEALQEQLKTINIVVVFEDGKEGKEAIGNMITSFQDLYEQTQEKRFDDFQFNYAAVGYMGRWVSDTLGWTKSFSNWLGFIQARAEDKSVEFVTYEHVMLRGLQEAALFLKDKQREHNIVIVIGSKINAETFPKLFDHVVPQLSTVCANLLFLQPDEGKAKNYSDLILQAKRILNEVGKGSKPFRQQIIVDNNMVKFRNDFRTIERCGNGYLYDFPEKSMQKGGLFFPKANTILCPDLLEWVMDTLFRQIEYDNEMLLQGMHSKFSMLRRLEQQVNPNLKEILSDQGIPGLPNQVANTFGDRFFVEVSADYAPAKPLESNFTPGFLIREDAFSELTRSLRKVVIDPKVNRNGDSEIDFKDRKRWGRELKRIYRERNRFFQKKGTARNASLAQVIFMRTGYPVNNAFFHRLKIKNIKNRRKVEQEELLPEIQRFYRAIFELEAYPSDRLEAILDRGKNQYYIIPLQTLP